MYEDDQGKLEADLNKIAKQYLRGWFLIDLLSALTMIIDILPLAQEKRIKFGQ